MSAAYLAQLDRPELDELIRTAEHAEKMAQLRFRMVPLDQAAEPMRACECGRVEHRAISRLEGAATVAQDCRSMLTDCYDASFVLLAAEMDRVFDLGGDPPEYQPDEDGE